MYFWMMLILCASHINSLTLTGELMFADLRCDSPTKISIEANDEDKQEVLQLLRRQVEAWNDGDIDRFMETYWKSDNLSFCSGGDLTLGWQATLDRYKSSYDTREKMGTLEFGDAKVQLLSKESAMVLGTWKLEFASNKTKPVSGRFTLILKKFDHGWRIIHDHTSSAKNDE